MQNLQRFLVVLKSGTSGLEADERRAIQAQDFGVRARHVGVAVAVQLSQGAEQVSALQKLEFRFELTQYPTTS